MKQTLLVATLATITIAGFSSFSQAQSRHRKSTAMAEAKAKCLEENPSLSGKALRKCMKDTKKK